MLAFAALAALIPAFVAAQVRMRTILTARSGVDSCLLTCLSTEHPRLCPVRLSDAYPPSHLHAPPALLL